MAYQYSNYCGSSCNQGDSAVVLNNENFQISPIKDFNDDNFSLGSDEFLESLFDDSGISDVLNIMPVKKPSVDSVQTQQQKVRLKPKRYKNNSNRRSKKRKLLNPTRVDNVNFEPTPYNHSQYQQQLGSNDIDNRPLVSTESSSNTTASTDSNSILESEFTPIIGQLRKIAPMLRQLVDNNCGVQQNETVENHQYTSSRVGEHEEVSAVNVQYNRAIQNFNQSMQRTEQSRQRVIMQRMLIDSPKLPASQEQQQQPRWEVVTQQLATDATAALTRSHSIVSFQSADSLTSGDKSSSAMSDKSTVMADFFSGSRSTLTDELEKSRKQLKVYVGQLSKDLA